MMDVAGEGCQGEITEHLEGPAVDRWAPKRAGMEGLRLPVSLHYQHIPGTMPTATAMEFLSLVILGLTFHQ